MKKLKALMVFGTRPEAIKMAPLCKKLLIQDEFETKVCVTAQHRSMLDQVLGIFNIKPDYDLNIMKASQTLAYITSGVLEGAENVMKHENPDIVLVHGDTTTTMAASIAAFYQKIPVGHVEAGLRSGNIYSPFPEEMNRRLTSDLCTLHFAPTLQNYQNLLKENITTNIFITGNTVIDTFKFTIKENYRFKSPALSAIDTFGGRIILMTAHRRENLGEPLENICRAVLRIAQKHPEYRIVYPVHLNPTVLGTAKKILSGQKNVILCEPLDIEDMHNLMAKAYLVLTDSGGLQEEAPALGKPVLVLRTETERPEAVIAGTVRMAGVKEEDIYRLAAELIDDPSQYQKMAHAVNPYGDGFASERIVQALLSYFGLGKPPDAFSPNADRTI